MNSNAQTNNSYWTDVLITFLISVVCIYAFFRSLINGLLSYWGTWLITATLLLIIVLLLIRCNGKVSVKKARVSIGAWIIFAVYICVHGQQYVSSGVSQVTFLLVLCILAGYLLSSTNFGWQKAAFKVMGMCCIIHSVATIILKFIPSIAISYVVPLFSSSSQSTAISQIQQGNVPGLTSHYSTNGIYLCFGVILFFAEYLSNRNGSLKLRRRNLICCAVNLIALFLTGKRAHLIIAVVAVFYLYYVCAAENKGSKIVKIFFAGFSLACGLLILVNVVPQISVVFSRFAELATTDDITNGRAYFYEYAVEWFEESPIIGIGWEGFKHRFNLTNGAYLGTFEYMNAHNVYLQILCELGVVGFLIFAYKLIATLLGYIRGTRWEEIEEKDTLMCLCLGLGIHIYFIIYCFTGNPIYDSEFFIFYFLCLAAASKSYKKLT